MNTYATTFVVALLVSTPSAIAAEGEPVPTTREAFAVVELFTSEGCSSCPPAEKVLNDLDRTSRDEGRRVFALAFHVDYWNRLGWADPFSDAAYSDRQRDYAVAFRSRSIYTPQMVVNGAAEFVGSRRTQADREINAALKTEPGLGVGLVVDAAEAGQTAELRWALDRFPDGATLNLAITEDGLSTDVPRGENRGLTLKHDGVVRAFASLTPTDTTGDWEIALPEGVDLSRASAVLFVQDTKTRKILAADRVALRPAER